MNRITCVLIVCFFFVLSLKAQDYKPADKKATPEAVALYNKLMKLQKKGIMYGHQDDLMYGYGWWYEKDRSDVKELTGDYPGVAGFEMGHIELGKERSLDSVSFVQMREQIIRFHKMGGVVTLSWHPDNPLTGGTAWDVTSKEVVKSILPSGSNHAKFNEWLTRLSEFFLSLKDDTGKPIPFLFRPYHEHSGSFFWWGKGLCSNDEYVQLWKYTVNFMYNRGLHTILYAYNTDRVTSWEEYMEGYPGDEYIDMLSIDMYDRGPQYFGELDNVLAFVSYTAQTKNKLAALSECGGRGRTWFSGKMLDVLKKYKLSYLLTWRHTWDSPRVSGPVKNSESAWDFLNFYHDPHTLFLKEVQEVQ